ncbi:MAG: hypothetical protein WBM53_13695 [Maribacter sp.]
MPKFNYEYIYLNCLVDTTITDLENTEALNGNHIGEAIQYRSFDGKGWLG